MRLKRLFLYMLIFSGVVFPGGRLYAAENEKQVINPHWTGKYCEECHLDKTPRKGNARLKFDGDPIKLCNRCHTRAFVTVEIHPINVSVDKEMQRIFPSQWPLNNGTISCLTCHDALAQAENNFPAKWGNPNFLRGAPYKKKTDFCFVCHPQEKFKKTNPHKQLDAQGKINSQTCLVCHEIVPDPAQQQGPSSVSLKGPAESLCVGCHPVHFASHGADKGQLLVSADMRKTMQSRERALSVDLPLNNDRVMCGTCHNPHDKGVQKRPEAASGAGEKYFLRLNGGYDLCVVCHADKRVQDRRRQAQHMLQETAGTAPGILSAHKPFAENKCKACHEITLQHREKPDAVSLCFRQGCHKTELLEKPYRHYKPVVGNCYACHESHASGYGKLLRINEETECHSCHPLLKDKNNREQPKIDTQRSTAEHRQFARYLKTSSVPEGDDCGFCHTMKHRSNIGTMAPRACSGCHTYVRGILQENASRPLNVHQTFKEKPCSKCHDPHAGPYQYQLKKPRETYLKEVSAAAR
jgi:predicted CXXCH cytochrome family protein